MPRIPPAVGANDVDALPLSTEGETTLVGDNNDDECDGDNGELRILMIGLLSRLIGEDGIGIAAATPLRLGVGRPNPSSITVCARFK